MCSPESLSPSRLRDRSSRNGPARRARRNPTYRRSHLPPIPLTADPTYRRSHLLPIPLTADPTYRRSHLPPIPLTADPTYRRSHLRSSDGISGLGEADRHGRGVCQGGGSGTDALHECDMQQAADGTRACSIDNRLITGNGRSATCDATRNTPCNMCTTQHTACVPCSRQTTCKMERGLDELRLPTARAAPIAEAP